MAGGNSPGPYSFGPFISQRGQTDPPTRDVVGLLFCAAFVAISFSLRPQPEGGHVLVKADKLVRTAGEPHKAN
jgi:hypothetical protein